MPGMRQTHTMSLVLQKRCSVNVTPGPGRCGPTISYRQPLAAGRVASSAAVHSTAESESLTEKPLDISFDRKAFGPSFVANFCFGLG